MSGKYINRLPRGMPADQTRALSDVFQDLHRDATQYQASGSGAVIRAIKDKLGEFVSVKDFGAVGDGVTNDTASVTAANAIPFAKYVPPGTYFTTLASTALDGPYWGRGQIRDNASNLRAPYFAAVKAAPSSFGNHDSQNTAFNGDLSRCQFPVEHRITGAATLGQPAVGYTYTPEAFPHYTYLYNESGWNQSTSSNVGRTGAAAYRTKVFHAGQGDAAAYNASVFVTGTRVGSTSFLANPAGVLYNGDLTAGQDGTYLNAGEFILQGGIYDVAAVGWVVSLVRNAAAGAKGAYWAGYRTQSQGTQSCDVAYSAVGGFRFGLDLSFCDFGANQAAITLKANQRIYGNVSATDPTSLSRYPAGLGTGEWLEYDSGNTGWLFAVNNAAAMIVKELEAIFNGGIAIKDGITAPGTAAGFARIYVDSADGDLKVKFGDGTTKTIVTDT